MDFKCFVKNINNGHIELEISYCRSQWGTHTWNAHLSGGMRPTAVPNPGHKTDRIGSLSGFLLCSSTV